MCLGAEPRQVVVIDGEVPSPDDMATPAEREAAAVRSPTWVSKPAPRSGRSRSTRCSSAPARTPGSRTCRPRPKCSKGAGSGRPACARRAGFAAGQAPGRSGGLDRVFIERDSSGGRAAFPCPWHESGPALPGERCAPPRTAIFEGRQGRAAAPISCPRVAAATSWQAGSQPADLGS